MKPLLILSLLLFSACLGAQDFKDSFLEQMFPSGKAQKSLRPFAAPKNRAQAFNPLYYAGASGIFLYQHVFSEQVQAQCNYHISCSETARRGIQKFGFFRGILIGIHQLNSCLPNVYREHPRSLITNEYKVDNSYLFAD